MKRFTYFLTLCLTISSCTKSADNTTSSAAPAEQVLACHSSVIDTGQKGSVATVARGIFSDTKLIPGTSYPAIAFSDPTALTMKISYWSGTQFNTEVLSGDGSGSFVRLVFTPTGIPMVFWTLGANLKVAIRSAAFPAAGNWIAGVIDTGTAPRAVEASMNPLGQVLVTFLTDTAATGRVKMLYCDVNCASPSSFQTMSPAAYIENTNINAAEVATGAAWCKVSATSYYPVAAYSVAGATRYAVCQNTLANCLKNTNWIFQTVTATNNLSTKLYLDSTLTGDIPKLISLGTTGIIPYKMGTTACTAVPTSFTAGSAIGTATSGSQWMTLLKDPTQKFHIVANEGTTGVRYYNSTGTDPTSTWNTFGSMETTTLAAVIGGGADVDLNSHALYASYGLNVLPFDLHLGQVANDTVASNLATFSHSTPDLTGNLQLGAAGSQLKNISAASNNEFIPAVAYIDFSVGASASAKLKFTLRSGTSSASPWNSHLVPGTINPQFPSLAFDSNDKPWIGYFEAATNKYFLVTNSQTDGSGTWTEIEFPSPSSGAPLALPAANNTALTMIQIGGIKNPLLAVIDTNATSRGIKAAYFNVTTRLWSTPAVIDTLASGSLGAAHLSVDADKSGNAAVAYQDLSLTRVKYSSTSDGLTWTSPITISSINQGPGTSIKINPFSGAPAVSYFDQTNNLVLYSSCAGNAISCASGGWSPTSIEGAAGVSGIIATSGQLLSTGLIFDMFGNPQVSYPRGQTNDGNLILWNKQTGFFVSAIESLGTNGSLVGTPALNFGVAGWGVSTTLNPVGGATSLFIGPGNWLYANSCGD